MGKGKLGISASRTSGGGLAWSIGFAPLAVFPAAIRVDVSNAKMGRDGALKWATG